MHGSKFERPPGNMQVSVFPGLAAPRITGNAQFFLSGGGLADSDMHDTDPATPLRMAANIGVDNRIFAAAPNAGQLTAVINAADGRIVGTFLHNARGESVRFSGAILQKQRRAGGWFRGPADNGAMSLAPAR
jgi:hypothetical protein